MLIEQGLLLDRYRLVRPKDSGGSGTVYEAWDTRLQRKVAIKRICLSSYADEDAAFEDEDGVYCSYSDSFSSAETSLIESGAPYKASPANFALDEALSLASQQDSNIVTIYDFQTQGNEAFLIMEYIDGISLAHLMRDYEDDVDLDVIAAIFQSVSHALEVMHRKNFLHLDIHPRNILINRQGQVKVVDFGVATLMDRFGFGWAPAGTRGYMPLEQISGWEVDQRTDEWALAAIMYEMLTDSNPFIRSNLEEDRAFLEDPHFDRPSESWVGLDEGIDDVLLVALDAETTERYPSVAHFRRELSPYLGDAQKGYRRLAALLNGVELPPEEDDESVEGDYSERIPLFSLVRNHLTPATLNALSRLFAALGSGFLSCLALINILPGTAAEGLLFWIPLVLTIAAALTAPHLGMLLSTVMFSSAVAVGANFPTGLLLCAASIAWWFDFGRKSNAAAECVLAFPLSSAIGMGQIVPLAAGFSLPPKRAAATMAYVVALGVVLAAFGTQSLSYWNPNTTWYFAGRFGDTAFVPLSDISDHTTYLSRVVSLFTFPAFWCVAASWLLAALALSVFRLNKTRPFAIAGVSTGAALLAFGVCLAKFVASGAETYLPAAINIVGTVLPALIMMAVCLVYPQRPFAERSDEDET